MTLLVLRQPRWCSEETWDYQWTDLLFGRPECEPTNHASDYIKALQEKLEQVYDFARGHLKVKSDKMKEWYDFALEGQQLQVGDPVWLHNPQTKKGLSPKLSSPWQGPFTVTKRINDLVYRVQLRPNTKPKVVHRNWLWQYSGSNVPNWFHAIQEIETGVTNTKPQESESPQPFQRSTRSRRPPERYGLS